LMTFPRNSAQCAWWDGGGSVVIDHTDTIVAEQSHLCETAPCKNVPLDDDLSGRLSSNTSTIKCCGMDPDRLWPDKPPLPTESSAKVQSAFVLPRHPAQQEHVPETDTAVVRWTEGLARKVAGHAASIQELRLEISTMATKLKEDLQTAFEEFQSSMASSKVDSKQIAEWHVSSYEDGNDGSVSKEDHLEETFSPSMLNLELDHQELRNIMQDEIDQRVMVSIWRIEQQQTQAMSKVDQFMEECSERFAKIKEHEVRMELILTKLNAAEQRLQACEDRVERLPTIGQVSMKCQEEFGRRLESLNHGRTDAMC